MLLNSLDKKIRQAFSNAAMQYEVLGQLQQEIGRELVQKIDAPEICSHLLDVGMGTGRLTNRLHLLFPEAKVIGIDFAYGMVEKAKEKYEGFAVLQADAKALPFKPDIFDIVLSNLAYQWAGNLSSAFQQVQAVLKRDGALHATLFGRETLCELFSALQSAAPSRAGSAHIQRLPSRAKVVDALESAGFTDIETQTEIIKTHFVDMLALVKWLKDIGANMVQKEFFVGKERLAKANVYYQENFKDAWGVYATFEVIWVKARKAG